MWPVPDDSVFEERLYIAGETAPTGLHREIGTGPEGQARAVQRYLLTPLAKGRPAVRLRLYVGQDDLRKLSGGPGFKGVVTDAITGQAYAIYGAPCGLRCYCDATAVPVSSADALVPEAGMRVGG